MSFWDELDWAEAEVASREADRKRKELETARASGDAEAIARAEAEHKEAVREEREAVGHYARMSAFKG